jgi:spermidine/putrescine transport system ATP-binding protein
MSASTSPGRAGSGRGGDLRLESLRKQFGDVVAVDTIDLTIPEGSFFALLGPSGCGKTTTLRMVAGLEQPTDGRVLIGEHDVTRLRPYQRPVNTVFQSYALFPHLDVFENVAFGLRRRGVRNVAGDVERMLELVELGGLGRRKPGQLSGGQQQRVALARALINSPSVLLLDEPLGALDLKLRRQMQLELKQIQNEVGVTFVHVTHDQEEAMTMADTVAVMNAGRIEQLGPASELYEHPRTTFVANFLGQSNLLPGTVEGRDGPLGVVAVAGTRLAVPSERIHADGSKVHVGVRPEKVAVTHADDVAATAVAANRLDGVIAGSRFTGVSTEYVVRTTAGAMMTVFVQNVGRDSRLVEGAEGVVHWDPQHTFALDARESAVAGLDPDAAELLGTGT